MIKTTTHASSCLFLWYYYYCFHFLWYILNYLFVHYFIRAGSLIPEYEVYLDEPSPGDVIAAGYDLTTGTGNLTIGNETVEAETSSVTLDNQTG